MPESSGLPAFRRNDGESLPAIGFGTRAMTAEAGVESIGHALEAGHRRLDTAMGHGNEREVGEALRRHQGARR